MALSPEAEEILDGTLKNVAGIVSDDLIKEAGMLMMHSTTKELEEDAALFIAAVISKHLKE